MKKATFEGVTKDLRGIVLSHGRDGDKIWLEIDEPLLRKIDQLLIRRERDAGATGAGATGAGATGAGSADVTAAPPPQARLETLPKSAEEAIGAVRNWYPTGEGGASKTTIGEAVLANLKARMVQLPPAIFDESWKAERRKGGGWIVTFSFLLAGQPRMAEWILDDVKREVRSGNPLSQELESLNQTKQRSGAAEKGKARLGRRRRA